MNKKKYTHTKAQKFLIYTFVFLVWPSLCILLLPIIMYFVQTKSAEIFGYWVKGSRNFFSDVWLFWKINSTYRNYSFLILFTGMPIFWLIFSYKVLYNKIIYKIKNRNNPEENSNWTYNQFTNEGSGRVLRKTFKAGKANFILGKIDKPFWKSPYIVNNTDAHGIVIGIAGSKKTEKIVIPGIDYNANLAQSEKPCMVISDPKKQILARTGNIFKQNGYEIKVFDFIDAKNSLYWNPLQEIWEEVHNTPKKELMPDNYNRAFEKIIEIVDALPWPINDKDTIWVTQAKAIIAAIIKFMLLYSLENGEFTLDFFTFKNVAAYTSMQLFTKGKWIDITKKFKEKNKYWLDFQKEQDALITIVPQTLSGMLANASNVLIAFSQNPIASRITSKTTINIKEIVRAEKPYVIFLCFPDHKQVFNFLISMLVTQIYRDAIDYANSLPKQRLPRMLQFYLEEFNSLKIPDIADWMSISRSRNILFLLVLQSYEQLKKYSEKGKDGDAIKSQARLTILLETNSDETLKSISTTLGDKEVKKESISKQSDSNKQTVSTSESKEAVMSIAQLKYKDKDMTIISSGGNKPIALRLVPAYKYLNTDSYTHILQNDNDNENIVDWDFAQMKKANLVTINKETNKEANDDTYWQSANNEEMLRQKLSFVDFKKIKTYSCFNTISKSESDEDEE
ncbi:type IV secretory system conjugative DNA transfer family protein [Mycoplasmopsis agalactiae]|nr:type IV secretory system conjugative DNA transfer family protein [Mycoplasmopsis agalactiae]